MAAVTAAAGAEVLTAGAAGVSMVVVASAAVVSTAVGMVVVSMAADLPTAAIAVARTEVPADPEGWEGRQRAISVTEELGRRRAEVLGTLRRDGIRLEDQETAGPWVLAAVETWVLLTARAWPTGNGIPSEAPTARLV